MSRKIHSNGKWFSLTVNHAPKPCKIFYTCILPSIDFYPKKTEEREKQQELRSHIQAPTRAPIAHPNTGESHPSTGEIITPQHRLDRHQPRPIDPKSISFSTQSSSAPPFSPLFLTTDLSLFPSTAEYDEFFCWVVFLLCLSIEKWYYIFVWKLRKSEKMWATSKKCVFYSIFKNTTKHQKIFFKVFFEMQPNTWKYFHFLKIFYTETNAALNSHVRKSSHLFYLL